MEFLDDEILEELLEREKDRLKDKLAKELITFRITGETKKIYEIVEQIERISRLQVELKVAKAQLQRLESI